MANILEKYKFRDYYEELAEQVIDTENTPEGPLDVLDLHNHKSWAALLALHTRLAFLRSRGISKLDIITGKGNRSQGNMPVLRPLVLDYLHYCKFRHCFEKDNDGVVIVEDFG